MASETIKRYLYLSGLLLVLVALISVGVDFISRVHVVAGILALAILMAYVLGPLVSFFCHPIAIYIPATSSFNLGLGRLSRKLTLRWGAQRRLIRVTRRGFPRLWAIVLTYCLLLLLLWVALGYLIPVLNEQFSALIKNMDQLGQGMQRTLWQVLQWARENAPPPLLPLIERFDPNSIQLDWVQEQLQQAVPGMMKGTFTGVKMAAGWLTGLFLIPLFAFYILLDAERYHAAFMSFVPPPRKVEVQQVLREIDTVLGRYIRGQIIVCITIGTSIGVALNLMGVEYAVLIGVFAGVIDFIPYVGVALGMIPAFFISLANHGIVTALLVLLVMEIIHQVEGHLIVPAVLGQSVGLPPLVVIVALLMGAELAGIMGMFLAIPLVAILRVLGQFYVRKMEQAYQPPPETPAAPPPESADPREALAASESNGQPQADEEVREAVKEAT